MRGRRPANIKKIKGLQDTHTNRLTGHKKMTERCRIVGQTKELQESIPGEFNDEASLNEKIVELQNEKTYEKLLIQVRIKDQKAGRMVWSTTTEFPGGREVQKPSIVNIKQEVSLPVPMPMVQSPKQPKVPAQAAKSNVVVASHQVVESRKISNAQPTELDRLVAIASVCEGDDYFVYGSIPAKKLHNAIKHFPIDPNDSVIALVDTTLFGSCKYGVALTLQGIVWRNPKSVPTRLKFLTWEDMQKNKHTAFIESHGNIGLGFGNHINGSPNFGSEQLLNVIMAILAFFEKKYGWQPPGNASDDEASYQDTGGGAEQPDNNIKPTHMQLTSPGQLSYLVEDDGDEHAIIVIIFLCASDLANKSLAEFVKICISRLSNPEYFQNPPRAVKRFRAELREIATASQKSSYDYQIWKSGVVTAITSVKQSEASIELSETVAEEIISEFQQSVADAECKKYNDGLNFVRHMHNRQTN